jgi:cell division protein FtsQ
MAVPEAALRKAVSVLMVVAFGTAAVWVMAYVLDRPIRAVNLSGDFERVSPLKVEAALGDLNGVGFLSADLDSLRERVAELSWVDEVRVQRRWPGELLIVINEQVPAARWGDSGLLNVRGELFLADTRHKYVELPALSGPDGSEALVARRYLDMRGPLAEAGQLLMGVSLDERGAWLLTLGNGMEVRLGRQQTDVRFDRFTRIVLPILAAADGGAGYVDMRYTRGFAIAWEQPGRPENNDRTGKDKDV